MLMFVVVDILDQEAREVIRQAPRTFNAEFNRSLPRTLGEFMRSFTRTSLRGKGGIRVRRRVNRVSSRGGPVIPAAARAIGFRGVLRRRGQLQGKEAAVRTTSPLAIIFEKGGVIRPRRGRFLTIQVDNVSAARRAGVRIRRGRRPRFIRVRSVRIRPRLRFFAQWRAFVPRARSRLFDSFKRARDRTQEQARRRAARIRTRRAA